MSTAVTELLYISFPVQILTKDSYFVWHFFWFFIASGKYQLQIFHNCSLLHPCNSTIYFILQILLTKVTQHYKIKDEIIWINLVFDTNIRLSKNNLFNTLNMLHIRKMKKYLNFTFQHQFFSHKIIFIFTTGQLWSLFSALTASSHTAMEHANSHSSSCSTSSNHTQ
jgi:hypothetical protein